MTPPPASRAEEIVKAWLLGSVDPLAEHQVKCLTGEIAKALEDYAREARDAERASVCQYGKEQRYKGLTEGAAQTHYAGLTKCWINGAKRRENKMPYIHKDKRIYFLPLMVELDRNVIANSGELNYLLTEIIQAYMRSNSKSYGIMNDVIGALDCCKEEFRRRVMNPYEDYKIETNGDVYKPETLK